MVTILIYADETVLIADTERKLHKLSQKVKGKQKKKGLNISCKKTEYMVVINRNNSTCKLQIGYNKIKPVQQFNYLGSVLTEDKGLGKMMPNLPGELE